MRISEIDPDLKLVELSDLMHPSPPDFVREYRNEFTRIAEWAEEFLWRPHDDLGRSGPVCPFVQMSMERGLFWQTAFRGQPSREEVRSRIISCREWFLKLEPSRGREARLKAILVLFPDVPEASAPDLIDGIQAELKPEFVEKGLMIGQFHSHCNVPGLHNPDFRPLRTPIPLLAIRHMVDSDKAFLLGDERLLAAYDRIMMEESGSFAGE